MMVMDWWRALDDATPGEPLAVVSIVSLSLVVTSCAINVFASRLRPSLLRAVGSAMLGVVASVLLIDRFQRWHTAPLYAILHLGLGLMSADNLRALWREYRHGRTAVCTVGCQAISCDRTQCTARRMLPIVPAHVDGGQEKRDA